jgi:hypothetical protein
LIEYLIPPKNTAIAQGEHVLFDLDVKGGEKNLGVFVAINAKGGDCWHVLQAAYVMIPSQILSWNH